MTIVSSLDRTPEAMRPSWPGGQPSLSRRHLRLSTAHVARPRAALAAAAAVSRETYGSRYCTATPDRTYVETLLNEQAAGRGLPFATTLRESGRVVGATRYLNIEYWTWPAGNPGQRGAAVPDAVEIGGTWLARKRSALPSTPRPSSLCSPTRSNRGMSIVCG